MSTAYVALLEKRMEGLSADDFDLELWKSTTILLLTRIFGAENAYSNEIANLKVDYSSWSLRDATSDYNPREACRRSGKDILELAIAELRLKEENDRSLESLRTTLQDKTGDLTEAIVSKDKKKVLGLLKKETKDDIAEALTKLLIE